MISSLKIEDGPYKGKLYEEIMFDDYPWIVRELEREKKRRGTNVVKKAKEIKLEQLIKKGEEKKTRRKCPFCNENNAHYFSVVMERYGQNKKVGAYCCSSHECFQRAITQNEIMAKEKRAMTRMYPIRFSSLVTIFSRHGTKDDFFRQTTGYFYFLFSMPEKVLCQQRDYIMFFQD